MAAAFPDQDAAPYRAVVFISVSWSDGSPASRGSGVLVGPNDVLTAAHVVQSATATATGIAIYPAFDGLPGPWGVFAGGAWRADYDPIPFAGPNLLSREAAARDLAVIGISDPLGDRVGALAMAPGLGDGAYEVVGYPAAQGLRLTADVGPVRYAKGVFEIGGLYHAAGSSGGPLLDAAGRVAGVVSTDAWAARLDDEWPDVQRWMAGNDSLIGAAPPAAFVVTDAATGRTAWIAAEPYAGPVAHLSNQYIGGDGPEVILGTAGDDFINAAGGTDAVDSGAGRDVVDGGTGSNFLSGGADQDVFFLDGRSGQATWSTIADWRDGEELSLWGFQPGRSTVSWVSTAGAVGYQGLTLHADLDGDGAIDTSVTWSGLNSPSQLPAPRQFDGLLWFT